MLARSLEKKGSPAGKQSTRGLQPTSSSRLLSSKQHLDEGYAPPQFSYRFADIAAAGSRENGISGQRPPALRWPIQAKLQLGAVNDPLEHEADRVADRVVRIADPAAPTLPLTSGAPRLQRKVLLWRLR
jgi:hypothetical protein